MNGGATCLEHFAPEIFDHLDTAYCPRCGLTIRWNEDTEVWDEDDSLTILVLEAREIEALQNLVVNGSLFKADEDSLKEKLNVA